MLALRFDLGCVVRDVTRLSARHIALIKMGTPGRGRGGPGRDRARDVAIRETSALLTMRHEHGTDRSRHTPSTRHIALIKLDARSRSSREDVPWPVRLARRANGSAPLPPLRYPVSPQEDQGRDRVREVAPRGPALYSPALRRWMHARRGRHRSKSPHAERSSRRPNQVGTPGRGRAVRTYPGRCVARGRPPTRLIAPSGNVHGCSACRPLPRRDSPREEARAATALTR